jgi:hypothetical protein
MKSSAPKSKKKLSPWKGISTSDIQAQIDSYLFARSVPGLGKVLIPKKHVSVQSSLLSVLNNDQLREAAEEVLESESLEDVFQPVLVQNPVLVGKPEVDRVLLGHGQHGEWLMGS